MTVCCRGRARGRGGPGLSCHSDVKGELAFENLLFLIELHTRQGSNLVL